VCSVSEHLVVQGACDKGRRLEDRTAPVIKAGHRSTALLW
jgi:hypothetical protein